MKVNLLEGKIKPTFYTLFASAIGSTIISTIYSSVDMICIGHHSGPMATAAISFVNPLWALMVAPGVLTGVGGSIMMSNRKASNNTPAANGYYTLSVIMTLFFSAVICASYLIFPRELLTFFGAGGEVLEYGIEYMRPIAVASPAFTMCMCLSTFMRNDGEAFTPTFATATGGIANIFLDIFLVFTLDLGVFGAGLATSIGQSISFIIIASYFFKSKCTLKFAKPRNISNKLMRIVTLGASAFILEIAFAITVTVYNKTISASFSEAHLAVYGTASTVAIMFFCLYNGIGTALQPLASANFGAKQQDRVSKTLALSLKLSCLLGFVFLFLSELFPGAILNIYMDVNEDVMSIGPDIMRIYLSSILFTGISIVSTFYFQSVLRRGYSLCISMARGIVFPILFVIILTLIFGKDAIWWSTPAAELATFILSVLLLISERRSGTKPTRI